MTTLHLAPDLELPLDVVTETFGILAKRGSGKTYTAMVMVEEMLTAGLPVCVVDPLGVWWGLRSSADGKGPGFPVVIFGGDHADVPLQETGGAVVADVIVEERIPAIIDLSGFSKSAGKRFMVDFAERLYHRNRDPLHLVIDEADQYAPQRTQADGLRLLGAIEDIVRRGRSKGLGCTMITQRPAVLNKDVLTQIEVLVVLRMTGPRDVAAIDEWVKLHADDAEATAVKKSLPSLPVGTAWFWSPGLLDILQRVKIRKRTTYDSSATPKVGEKLRVPKQMAEIDLEALGERITATIDQAKANDPRHLKTRIRDLEVELDQARRTTTPLEVPAVTEQEWAEFRDLCTEVTKLGYRMSDVLLEALPTLASPDPRIIRPGDAIAAPRPTMQAPQPRPAPRAATPVDSEVKLGGTEKNVMRVLAEHGPRTVDQIALLAGYSRKASTIGVALGKLRAAGYVAPSQKGQPVEATQEGVDWLGAYEPLPTGRALLDYWRNRFGKTEQNVLDAFVHVHPRETSLREVAEITGYSPEASTIGVAAGKLRKVGVLDGWRISDDFAASAGLS